MYFPATKFKIIKFTWVYLHNILLIVHKSLDIWKTKNSYLTTDSFCEGVG